MNSVQPVTLEDSEVRTLKSDIVDQEYHISVALPQSYSDQNAQEMSYPVIVHLDGNWRFGSLTEITRLMVFCGALTETIVVGIGYPAGKTQAETTRNIWGLRGRDYTPFRDEKWEDKTKETMGIGTITSGGSSEFRSFIREELLPFIESVYRVHRSQKVLVAHSLGALFVLDTVFHEPALFQGYVASSPSLWFGHEAMFSIEEEYASRHDDLQARLFLSVGEDEESVESRMVSNLFRFMAQLQSREFAGLTAKHQVVAGAKHCDSYALGFQMGLKWIFSSF